MFRWRTRKRMKLQYIFSLLRWSKLLKVRLNHLIITRKVHLHWLRRLLALLMPRISNHRKSPSVQLSFRFQSYCNPFSIYDVLNAQRIDLTRRILVKQHSLRFFSLLWKSLIAKLEFFIVTRRIEQIWKAENCQTYCALGQDSGIWYDTENFYVPFLVERPVSRAVSDCWCLLGWSLCLRSLGLVSESRGFAKRFINSQTWMRSAMDSTVQLLIGLKIARGCS